MTIHKATNLKSLPSTSFKHSRKSVFITTIQIVPGYEDACISLSGSGYNIQSSIEQTLICDGCDSEFWRYFTKGDGYGQIFCDGNLVGNFVIPLSPILNSVDGYNRKWFIVEDMDGEPKAAVNFSARFTSGVEFGVKPLISTSWAVRADIKIQESESGYLFLVNKTEIGNEMILDKGDFEISVVDGEGYLVGKLFFNGNSAYEHVMRGIRRRRVITETIVETCWVISEGDEFYGESFQVTVNFESYDSKSVSKVQKQLEIPVIEEIIEQPIEKVVEIQVESPKREISQQTEIQVPQTTFIITIHETTVNATTAKFNWPPSNGTLYTVSLITPSPSIFKIPTSSIKELLNTDLTVEFLKNDNRIGISRIELAMNVLEEINGWYKIVNDGIEVGTCLVEIKYDCKCIEAEIARVLFSVEEWKEAVNYDKSFQEEFVAQVLEFQESPDIVEPSNIINTSPDKSVHFDTLKSLAESMIEICINASTDDRNIESEFHEEYTLTPVLNILDHYWLSSPKMSPKVKHDALKPDTPVSSPRSKIVSPKHETPLSSPRSKIVSPKHETPLSSPRSKIISPQNTHLYYSPKLALNSYNIESRNIKTQQYFADVNEEFVYRKNEIGLKDVKMLGKEFKQEKVEPVLEKKDAVFGKSEIERLLAIYSK